MKKFLAKLLVIVACLFLILGANSLVVNAASYSSDYRNWSQGASSYEKMNKYGCWVVAQAKLLYESNIDRSSSFNPDTYMVWEQNNGYLNSSFMQVNGTNAPVAYAKSKGKTLYYLGKTTSSMESKIWDNISKGYWTLLCVRTSSGVEHYVMVANALSSQNGTLYCYNSFTGYSSASPSSIASRKYTITDVYTYSTDSSSSVTISKDTANTSISDTNAILWARVDKPSSSAVTKIGIKVRKDGSTYEKGWSKYEAPSKSYVGASYMQPYYNLNSELNLQLTHATKYYYMFYAVVDGKEYWSSEFNITTTGSHTYGSWTTTTAAKCTTTGSQKRSCSCGATETKAIAALGHNYSSSWTVDTAATCTVNGSKSHHCTRCSAKADVTAINATGHSWSNWTTTKIATCTVSGTQQRNCSTCSTKETKNISATGHNYSGNFTVDSPASCTKDGSKSKHCSSCSAKTELTTIKATGHKWSDFVVKVAATTEKTGTSERKCLNSGCSAIETITTPKLAADGHTHSFTQWTIKTEAGCETEGIQQSKCSKCNEIQQQTISPLGHSFGEWSAADANGTSKRTCNRCGKSEEEKISTDNTASETLPAESDSSSKNNTTTVLLIIVSVLAVGATGALAFVLFKKKYFKS